MVTADWIDGRTSREQRARLLGRIGEGFSVDQVLHETLGLDTDGLDAAVRKEIRSEFLTLSDGMLCSEAWHQGVSETLESAMKIVLHRRKFLDEFEDSYRREHDA